MKRRNVAYLGLLRVAQDGMIDITEIYIARYGEPRPGEKVFIVTRQQKDGWEGEDKETSEIVPGKPEGQQAAGAAALTLKVHMHKGCTRDAKGIETSGMQEQEQGGEAGTQKEMGSFSGSKGLQAGEGSGDSVGCAGGTHERGPVFQGRRVVSAPCSFDGNARGRPGCAGT